jgi:hypothetical protein
MFWGVKKCLKLSHASLRKKRLLLKLVQETTGTKAAQNTERLRSEIMLNLSNILSFGEKKSVKDVVTDKPRSPSQVAGVPVRDSMFIAKKQNRLSIDQICRTRK